jgi:hypothetical protein
MMPRMPLKAFPPLWMTPMISDRRLTPIAT